MVHLMSLEANAINIFPPISYRQKWMKVQMGRFTGN